MIKYLYVQITSNSKFHQKSIETDSNAGKSRDAAFLAKNKHRSGKKKKQNKARKYAKNYNKCTKN